MTPEEIIQYLEMVRPTENYSHTFSVSVGNTRHFGPGSQLNKDVSTAIDFAIQALEKQIPKKPRYYIDNWGHNRPGCPGCARNEILYAGQKYCSVCGTKIDWSDPKHD